MKITGFTLLLLCILTGSKVVLAQHKILMLNGKTIEAQHYAIGDVFLTYRKEEGKSLKAIDRFDVFSVTDNSGVETVLYSPADSLDFSIEEARHYILGEQTATQYYKKASTTWSAVAIGAGSSILSFYSLPVPMMYAVVLGRFNPPVKGVPSTIDPNIVSGEAFIYGYQKAARNLKIQRSLKWGYISLGTALTGLIVYGATR
jgi:hypothetical protein